MAKAGKKKARKVGPVTPGLAIDLNSPSSVRSIAMNAGDLSRSVMQEVTRIMADKRDSQVRSIQVGIQRLRKEGHISAQEAKDLAAISRLVLGATRPRASVARASTQVRAMYQRMVISSGSSPVALAIASAASASFAPASPVGLPSGVMAATVTGTPGTTGVGAVVGGVIGGVIGGVVGGGLGAGLGAAIGAAAGAAIGFCNEKGV